jgi:membrane protein implicated in regulation of membrane protease activity
MDSLPQFVMAHAFWSWMALGAVLLAVEVVSGSGWLLWPAGSAALTAVAVVVWPQLTQPMAVAVFGVLTIITTYVGRRFIRGSPTRADDVNNPLARLVGHHGEAATAFEGGCGRVFVDGKEWSAELDGAELLTPGAKVEVVEVLGGARLRVRARG